MKVSTMRKLFFCLLVSLSPCLLVSDAAAGTPRLTRLLPPGGQRGTTVEVDFTGRFLDQPREVLFYEPGITVESIKPVESAIAPNGREQPVEAGTRLRVRMKLAADCQLGPHGLRLRTAATGGSM